MTPRPAKRTPITSPAHARDPATFHVDASTPGLAGVLVLVAACVDKPTPAALRTRLGDALDRAAPPSSLAWTPGQRASYAPDALAALDAALASHLTNATRFMVTLPDVVTPVAALGLAVRVAVDAGHRWQHNRTAEKASRWTYCAATVTEDTVSILGANTSAEALPDGRLVIDPDVPSDVAARLRAAYDDARGVVEPSRVLALVVAYLRGIGGRQITSDVVLVPETTSTTCGVLAGLVDLGGWADTVPVADPARIARLTSPVTKSIEEQIASVVEDTRAFIARAVDVAKPGSTGKLQARTGDTVREQIAAARAAASLWRDRLSLASLDVDAALGDLEREADAADAAALAAVEERRKARKLAREVATLTGAEAAALDDEQARDERRAHRDRYAPADSADVDAPLGGGSRTVTVLGGAR